MAGKKKTVNKAAENTTSRVTSEDAVSPNLDPKPSKPVKQKPSNTHAITMIRKLYRYVATDIYIAKTGVKPGDKLRAEIIQRANDLFPEE